MSFGAVAAIGGAVIGAAASDSAADKQAGSANAATAAQREATDKQIALQKPFRDTGVTANNRLAYLLGLGPDTGSADSYEDYQRRLAAADADHRRQYGIGIDDIDQGVAEKWRQDILNGARVPGSEGGGQTGDGYGSLMQKFGMDQFQVDPGYQFRMDEGMRGVEGSAAARGGLLSGAAQKAIQKYGQGLASQEYGNAYNRYTADQTNQYNRLAGLVNTGQGATNQISNAVGQFGQNSANNLIGAGNAQASGIMGGANALVGGINQGFNSYQNNELMKLIRNPGSTQQPAMDWYN